MREIQFIIDYIKSVYILEEKTYSLTPKNIFESSKIPYKEEAYLYKKEKGVTSIELFLSETKKSYIFDCYAKSGFFKFYIDKDIDKSNVFRIIDTALISDNYFKSCLRQYRIKNL